MGDRVLIVDDEELIRSMLADLFQGEGFETQEAESAELALVKTASAKFDLAFVDKNLPGMSGVELIRIVRATDDDMSIVMMTGYASEESIIETIALGIDSYIEKPFPSIAEIIATARTILENKRRLAARPKEVRPIRVLVSISGEEDRNRIRKALGLVPVPVEVSFSDTHAEALDDAKEKQADVIVVDANAWREKTPEAVEELKAAWPSGRCVVISAGNLSTASLRKLVDLGVIAVLDWTDPRWGQKLQEAVRKRRPIS